MNTNCNGKQSKATAQGQQENFVNSNDVADVIDDFLSNNQGSDDDLNQILNNPEQVLSEGKWFIDFFTSESVTVSQKQGSFPDNTITELEELSTFPKTLTGDVFVAPREIREIPATVTEYQNAQIDETISYSSQSSVESGYVSLVLSPQPSTNYGQLAPISSSSSTTSELSSLIHVSKRGRKPKPWNDEERNKQYLAGAIDSADKKKRENNISCRKSRAKKKEEEIKLKKALQIEVNKNTEFVACSLSTSSTSSSLGQVDKRGSNSKPWTDPEHNERYLAEAPDSADKEKRKKCIASGKSRIKRNEGVAKLKELLRNIKNKQLME